jgi:hypothetical protein
VAEIKLTPQQEKFAQLVAHGSSYSNAYREAYRTAKMKPATINRSAHELANNPKITARIAEIHKQIAEDNGWTNDRSVAEKLAFLNAIKGTMEKDQRVSQGTANAFLGVIKELDATLLEQAGGDDEPQLIFERGDPDED